jgi:phenylacetic acid degradation operon negative regulatory protein
MALVKVLRSYFDAGKNLRSVERMRETDQFNVPGGTLNLTLPFLQILVSLTSMRAKTEEFLYFLFWAAECFTHPTFRNLTDSFEGWAYRSGFGKELAKLERHDLVERSPGAAKDRVYRLTEAGRLHALGGRDPQTWWSRAWDGRWRLVLFDIPMSRNTERKWLRRYLQHRHFGCLQGSVWITPDPVTEERQILAEGPSNVESLLLFDGQPCGDESDAQIVASGWNWEMINACYAEHSRILREMPTKAIQSNAHVQSLRVWAATERASWLAAIERDPLLPERILPAGYLGREAWRRRAEVVAALRNQLQIIAST